MNSGSVIPDWSDQPSLLFFDVLQQVFTVLMGGMFASIMLLFQKTGTCVGIGSCNSRLFPLRAAGNWWSEHSAVVDL